LHETHRAHAALPRILDIPPPIDGSATNLHTNAMPLQRITPTDYSALLAQKIDRFKQDFAPLGLPEPAVFASAPLHYRLRAEFRMVHNGDAIAYAMFAPEEPRRPIAIEEFPVADKTISEIMPRLRAQLEGSEILKKRLFQVNFLATLSGELLVSLIYHHRLDETWEAAARALAADLGVQLIGRSRQQKIVFGRDWLQEEFELDGRTLRYQQIEGSFSQPNGGINRQMLHWACRQVADIGGDLLELYCGNGNFTVALAPSFNRVLATEVSKSSVQSARHNLAANGIDNTNLVRMSSDEISAALAKVRTFNRLGELDLEQFRFTTLFVDPPRSGLDAATVDLARGFTHVLYISCNPTTLHRDVSELLPSHEIRAAAAFDQFPYTDHLECGLLLSRCSPKDQASRI
jgi:tRNA (uracil-5-)-methyltransferase